MSRICAASRAPLSTELAVIASRTGSRQVTTLKLPLVPRTQPRAWKRRPAAMSASAACEWDSATSSTLGTSRGVAFHKSLDVTVQRTIHTCREADQVSREHLEQQRGGYRRP